MRPLYGVCTKHIGNKGLSLSSNYYTMVNNIMFFRRIDDDRGKSYELGQSAVKCMRGILECWVKQSSRIELFKRNQCNRFALHCKFHLDTGDEIFKDADYNHLQVIIVHIKI